jgi:predicted PurR-regulated permease PerM
MLLLVAMMIGGVGWVFLPILPTALVSASLAALTYGALFSPINGLARRLLPRLRPEWRHRGSAAVATLVLVTAVASPVLLLLVTSLDGIGPTVLMIKGLVMREPLQITRAAEIISAQVGAMRNLMPSLPLDPRDVHDRIVDILSHSNAQDFYGYLFHGTGGLVARLALGIAFLFACYDQGAELVRRMLTLLPLSGSQCEDLMQRFRHSSLRLLSDTIATTVAKGLALGALAWAIGGVPFSVVAAVAAFVGLIPVVGFATVWLPIASFLWSHGHPLHAATLAVTSLAAAWLIDFAGRRLTKTLHPHGLWMGFLLFLGLVGGLLGFGLAGLVVGPMAVVLLRVISGFWLPLYGVGAPEPDPDGPA